MIAPVLDQLAEEYDGKLTIAKMDVDSSPVTPNQYGVRGIPTLMVFNNGDIQGTKVGAVNKGMLQSFINESV
jgi:thioredoxin 1